MGNASRRPRRPLSSREVNARIGELRRQRIASRDAPEDLDAPVDPDIRVTTRFPHHKLELIVDGEGVSWTSVVDFQQQIGSQTVRMGGIAGVGTRGDCRFQGYGRRVMENSLRWMRREGFDTAMLYGIPAYYPKFGYAQAFPSIEFSLAVRDAERAVPNGFRFVSFARRHLGAVLRMYARNSAGRTGFTLRDPRHWRPFRKGVHYGTEAVCKVALDARERPVGYWVRDSSAASATVIEVGFATRAVFPDVLRAAARRAVRQRVERIKLLVPEDDAFADFCKPFGLSQQTTWRPDGGGQVRMIRIRNALRKVAPLLASRLDGTGCLTLRTNLDDVGLTWADGRLSIGERLPTGPVARMPQWALAQLLYGYRTARALVADGTLAASRPAVGILERLFPLAPHYQYLVDHF